MKNPFIFAALVVALAPFSAFGNSTTFQTGVSPSGSYDADIVRIRQSTPTANQTGAALIAGRNGGITLRSLFSFDISEILSITSQPASMIEIDSITLTLRTLSATASGNNTTAFSMNLFALPDTFGQTTVTWNNAPNTAGGTVGNTLASAVGFGTGVAPSSTNHTWTGNATFRSFAEDALAGDGNLNFMLRGSNEATSEASAFFENDLSATTASRPSLTIEYTVIPEPSTGLMVVFGLIMMVVVRRRMRLA